MEDYEKKYKEALSRAATELETCGADKSLRNMIYAIFPDELAESEDKKIRNRILLSLEKDLMATKNSGCDTQDLEQCIAWLEKQGEKKPTEVRTTGYWNVKDIEQKPFDYEHTTITQKDFASVGETATIELSSPIDCGDRIYHVSHKPIEKQGKQKPAVTDFNAKDWYVSKVDGKIHDMTYNPTDKVEPKFKVKYAGSEYNVLEVKDIAGVTFYGIEDEPNHIDYVKADNCEIISGYGIKENGSPYPTKPSMFSEQKPADKVEPKFHEGEWIVWKNKCYKVNYNGCGYELIDQNGLSTSLEYGTVDENAHLWDITKDAKDGDVVVDKSDGTIGIFESIGHHPDGGSFNDPSYCFLHCRYDDGYFFADFEDGNMMTSDDVIPAIKEQSDILFTEMKEAGYEWSDKDRKLIKIVK